MRYLAFKVTILALCFSASFSASATPIAVNISDYAELGEIKAVAKTVYNELSLTKGTVSTLGLLINGGLSTMSAVRTATAYNLPPLAAIATTFGTTSHVRSAVLSADSSEQLGDIVRPFTGIGAITHPLLSGLYNFSSQVESLNNQLLAETPVTPIDNISYAIMVSKRSLSEANALLSSTNIALNDLVPVWQNIYESEAQLQVYREQIGNALEVVRGYQEAFASAPFLPYVLNNAIAATFMAEIDLNEAWNLSYDLERRFDTLRDSLNARTVQFTDLKLNLEASINSNQPLGSKWEVMVNGDKNFSLYTNPYNINFDGAEWSEEFTEIDGPFLLGTLHLTNNECWSNCDESPSLNFQVERTVDDPYYQTPITTVGSADLSLLYMSTPNIGTAEQQADIFSASGLGINMHIFEGFRADFYVFGQYDSPLRIVDIKLATDSSGGFISLSPTSVPEPSVVWLLATGLAGILLTMQKRAKITTGI